MAMEKGNRSYRLILQTIITVWLVFFAYSGEMFVNMEQLSVQLTIFLLVLYVFYISTNGKLLFAFLLGVTFLNITGTIIVIDFPFKYTIHTVLATLILITTTTIWQQNKHNLVH